MSSSVNAAPAPAEELKYKPYKMLCCWYINDFFKKDVIEAEGPLTWSIKTVRSGCNYSSRLSFTPSHRDLQQFTGDWKIQGKLKFFEKETDNVISEVKFMCNQSSPVHTFDPGFLVGKEKSVTLITEYTNLVGMGVTPRPDYFVASEWTDVVLIVEKKRLHLNKAVLASLSDYFKVMFSGNFVEASKKEIAINDVDSDQFVALLDLCFDSFLICGSDVKDLLVLADRFSVPSALHKIERFLIEVDTSDLSNTELLVIADKYKLLALLSRVLSKFSRDEMKDFLKCDDKHNTSHATLVAVMDTMEKFIQ